MQIVDDDAFSSTEDAQMGGVDVKNVVMLKGAGGEWTVEGRSVR